MATKGTAPAGVYACGCGGAHPLSTDCPEITAAEPRLLDTYGHVYAVMRPGGTCTYMARQERYLGDGVGTWFGWVGDGVDEHGDLRWWAEWREDGDAAARWDSGPVFDTFTEARDALRARRAAGTS